MIALHTRSRCDECDKIAAVEIEPDCFLCEGCFGIVLATLANSNPAVASISTGETAVTAIPAPGLTVAAEFISVNTAVTETLASREKVSGETTNRELLIPGLRPESGGVTPTAQMTRSDGSKRAEVQGSALADEEGGKPSTKSLNFETEVSALEAEWSRAGVNLSDDPLAIPSFLDRKNPDCKFQNSNSLRVRAESEIAASSVA
jgi:hypothetical protein